MQVQEVDAATPELLEAMQRLVPQLSASARLPDMQALEDLVRDQSSKLIIVREPDESGRIIAMGTLGVYRAPTGVRAVIEDVVVDEAYRGQGLGEALVRRLLEIARAQGAPGATLTSNPRRVAANRLYVRMGFRRRRTNSYFYSLL